MTAIELVLALQEAHITQADLARRLGVTRRLVCYWIEGARPVPARRIPDIVTVLPMLARPGMPSPPVRLRRIVRAAGLTERDVARMLGVKHSLVRAWLRGKEPIPLAVWQQARSWL